MKREQREIFRHLKTYLKKYPELRVGQAIENLTYDKDHVPFYYLSDFAFLRSMKENMRKL